MKYEFHITLNNCNKEDFNIFCSNNGIKPIVLHIQRNDGNTLYSEVMTSSTLDLEDNNAAYEYLDILSKKLENSGFDIIRRKIEAEISYTGEYLYIESHINVIVSNNDISILKDICIKHSAHLSKNISKKYDNSYIIMVTIRSYNDTIENFIIKMNLLLQDINKNYDVQKEIIEYVIYDDNNDIDLKWIKE